MAIKAKIGVFGIGLAAYWPQFDGLKERLEGYQRDVEANIAAMGAEVISAGLVDNAPGAQQAGDLFASHNVDLIVCYVGTYATSSQVLPAVQRRKAPVLILNLQPIPALNYLDTDTAEWLANCCACCVPEISNAFARSRIQFNVVTGLLHPVEGYAAQYHERAWREIAEWIDAASVMRELSYSRIGFLGHTYPGMLDMYSDFTMHHGQLGAHSEVLEMDDLHQRVSAASTEEINAKVDEIRSVFNIVGRGRDKISQDVTPEALNWAAPPIGQVQPHDSIMRLQ